MTWKNRPVRWRAEHVDENGALHAFCAAMAREGLRHRVLPECSGLVIVLLVTGSVAAARRSRRVSSRRASAPSQWCVGPRRVLVYLLLHCSDPFNHQPRGFVTDHGIEITREMTSAKSFSFARGGGAGREKVSASCSRSQYLQAHRGGTDRPRQPSTLFVRRSGTIPPNFTPRGGGLIDEPLLDHLAPPRRWLAAPTRLTGTCLYYDTRQPIYGIASGDWWLRAVSGGDPMTADRRASRCAPSATSAGGGRNRSWQVGVGWFVGVTGSSSGLELNAACHHSSSRR